MYMKKILVSLLCMLIVFVTLYSCANDDVDNQAGSDNLDNKNTVKETEDPIKAAMEKMPVINYNGREFNFFIPDCVPTHRDVITEAFTGEVLNDAKYSRFLTVENKYNIKIKQNYFGEPWETYNNINKNVMADDTPFDLVYLVDNNAQVLAAGLVLDLYKLEYPNFDNPWWNKSYIDELAVKNVLLMCPSSINLLFSSAICFNKQMIEDFNMETPYALVKSNDWIIDKLFEMALTVTSDLNGDGVMDINDRYGFSSQNSWFLSGVLHAGGYRVLVKNENGLPELNKDYGHLVKLIEKSMKLFTQDNVAFMYGNMINDKHPIPMNSGRVFALYCHLSEVALLRDSDVDYGIVPYPKLDKDQKNYTGILWGPFYGISINAPDPEMSGLIFEALCAESYYSVQPVFREQHLSAKFARDDEAIEMLEIIHNNILFEMARYYYTLSPYTGIVAQMYQSKSTDVMSYIAKNEDKMQSALDDIIASYDAYVK